MPNIKVVPASVDEFFMSKKKQNFVEIFSGAGLFGQAFLSSGFTPLLAVDADSDAIQSYKNNIGVDAVCSDVRTVKFSDPTDVLIAGPPCQGFSSLNRNRKDDPRNELCFEIVRWVRRCSPKVVVVENVAPFAKTEICDRLRKRLKRAGYNSTVMVLDASHFGTPQCRRRTVVIASRDFDVADFRLENRAATTVREAWQKLPRKKEDPQGFAYPIPSELALSRFKVIPTNGDRRDVMENAPNLAPQSWLRLRPNDNTGVWGRMDFDAPAPTIRTCFQNPSKGRYIHPKKNRVISIREAARLQQVPDHWFFAGSRSSVARQIGNGVPIGLGTALAKGCKRLLAS